MHEENQNDCPRCGAPLEAARQSTDPAGSPAVCPACLLIGAAQRPSADGTLGGASPFDAPRVDVINAALPAYDVQTLLGQGGAGTVYRARHLKLDRLVAIKVLRPAPTSDVAEAAAFAERFEREARVLAKLDHPHIVRIYDFGQSTGASGDMAPFFYLVLEYVEGASLRDLLASGRLTPREVLELVPQICDALQSAHDLGIVHRDIKPENILIDGAGRVRIADFGLAKLRGTEPTAYGLTRTDQVMGTLHYMAPEQMRASGAVDHRADLFSVGVVLYEMLTGELPIGRFSPPSRAGADAKSLDHVVLKALENDPEARYQAASELQGEIESKAAATSIQTGAAERRRSTRYRRRQLRRESQSARIASHNSGSRTSTEAAPRKTNVHAVRPSVAASAAATPATDPAEKFTLIRTLVALAVLLGAFNQTWFTVSSRAYWNDTAESLMGPFAGSGLFANMPNRTLPVNGLDATLQMGIFEFPFFFALFGFGVVAALRVCRRFGASTSELIPWLITVASFVMTGLFLMTVILADGVDLRGGLVIAFVTFLLSSMFDVAAFLERGEKRARRREMARELSRSAS